MNVSFIHGGGPEMASYRYRAQIPSDELSASLNDRDADCLIFAKPVKDDIAIADACHARGGKVIVDICDPHLHLPHYQRLIELADAVTASTAWLATMIEQDCSRACVNVIPDPYEFDELPPHTTGSSLFWFGHKTNYYSLERFLPWIDEVRVMSNLDGAIPWSVDGLKAELAKADIVLIPETAPYKSANRTVEAIRAGCFVVAEPHPSLEGIPGIWIGDLRKGIIWARANPDLCRAQLTQSQAYVRERYSPERVGNAWRTLFIKLENALYKVGERNE